MRTQTVEGFSFPPVKSGADVSLIPRTLSTLCVLGGRPSCLPHPNINIPTRAATTRKHRWKYVGTCPLSLASFVFSHDSAYVYVHTYPRLVLVSMVVLPAQPATCSEGLLRDWGPLGVASMKGTEFRDLALHFSQASPFSAHLSHNHPSFTVLSSGHTYIP